MVQRDTLKLLGALALLGVAGGLLYLALFGRSTPGEQAFFYDPSAEELFTAPKTAVPPIRGIDGDEEDAVRAVVISVTGDPADRDSWRIAYLERYSPELKRQMEQAQQSGGSPAIGRGAAQAHRFIRRPDQDAWHPMNSPQAELILNAWLTAGPNGQPAVICTP